MRDEPDFIEQRFARFHDASVFGFVGVGEQGGEEVAIASADQFLLLFQAVGFERSGVGADVAAFAVFYKEGRSGRLGHDSRHRVNGWIAREEIGLKGFGGWSVDDRNIQK